MTRRVGFASFVCAIAALFTSSFASAAAITPGTYRLHNHPDGDVNPPPYGMRLDEIYNVSGGNDEFTLDFDHAQSNVTLVFNGTNTITIAGVAYGGIDIGGSYLNDAHLGLYQINFVYDVGVGLAGGDDDLIVIPGANAQNFGSITPLDAGHPDVGVPLTLFDVRDGNFSFRFGDEDNDNGHRGFNGLSGWGWVGFNGNAHPGSADDFLFTAELIPEPASAMLLLMGLGAAAIRRRR